MARQKKGNNSNEEDSNNENISEKDLKIQQAMAAMRKQFGRNDVIQTLRDEAGSGENVFNVKFNSTGVLSVDKALGGGFPEGRIIELYGAQSSGKTLLALTFIAEMQKRGHIAAFIDVEHAFDPSWARKNGVDTDSLLFAQPDSGEEALEVMEALIRTGYVSVVVLDSVAALVTKKELEGDMGDAHVGQQARLMGQAMRKLTAAISKSHTTAIFINQIREKVGVTYGPTTTTSGGRALPFFASQRVELAKIESIKMSSTNEEIGSVIKARVVKNKVSPPFKIAQYDIRFDIGIDKVGNLIELGSSAGLVEKSGAWFSYEGKKAQGLDKMRDLLTGEPELLEKLKSKLME